MFPSRKIHSFEIRNKAFQVFVVVDVVLFLKQKDKTVSLFQRNQYTEITFHLL